MPTKARYLKSFQIAWSYPHGNFNPGEQRGLTRGDVVIGVNRKLSGFKGLTDIITANLRRQKIMLAPEITHATIQLSNVEAPYFALCPNGKGEPFRLECHHWIGPLDILDMPDEPVALGLIGIQIVEEFLSTVAHFEYAIDSFPFDVFEQSIEAFRKRSMIVRYKPHPTQILNTPVKAIFQAESTPTETSVWLTLKIGRNELFKRKIDSKVGVSVAGAFCYPEATTGADSLEIHGVIDQTGSVIKIPFAEFPTSILSYLKNPK